MKKLFLMKVIHISGDIAGFFSEVFIDSIYYWIITFTLGVSIGGGLAGALLGVSSNEMMIKLTALVYRSPEAMLGIIIGLWSCMIIFMIVITGARKITDHLMRDESPAPA